MRCDNEKPPEFLGVQRSMSQEQGVMTLSREKHTSRDTMVVGVCHRWERLKIF